VSTSNPIAVAGLESAKVEISTDAYTRRTEVIEAAKFCPSAVTDADTQAEVTSAVRDIKRLLKEVEDGRKAAKAPALDIGRKIDDAAAELHAAAVRVRRLKPADGSAGDVTEARHAEGLHLTALLALALSVIGVAAVMRARLHAHLETLAVLRICGATLSMVGMVFIAQA